VAEREAAADLQVGVDQLIEAPALVGEAAGEAVEGPVRTRSAASGSAETRSAPATRVSSSAAWAGSKASSSMRIAPARPVRRRREVTMTAHSGLPGSRGRTWRSSAALSSTMRARRPSSRAR
jgi:hypothetical protein